MWMSPWQFSAVCLFKLWWVDSTNTKLNRIHDLQSYCIPHGCL